MNTAREFFHRYETFMKDGPQMCGAGDREIRVDVVSEMEKRTRENEEGVKESLRMLKLLKAMDETGGALHECTTQNEGKTMNAISEWDSKLAGLVNSGMSKKDATRKLVAENPELHKRYLAQYNVQHGRAV